MLENPDGSFAPPLTDRQRLMDLRVSARTAGSVNVTAILDRLARMNRDNLLLLAVAAGIADAPVMTREGLIVALAQER